LSRALTLSRQRPTIRWETAKPRVSRGVITRREKAAARGWLQVMSRGEC
jgi:hypothetical protein